MKKNKLTLALATLALILAPAAMHAEDTDEWKETKIIDKAFLKGWIVKLGAGLNIGGTAPLPIPAEIRSIDSYNPTLCIALQGKAEKFFTQHWGLALALRFEPKGMKTDATTKNYHMAIIQDGARTEGYWTGGVHTKFSGTYFTVPILAVWQATKRWQVYAGPYVSLMLDSEFSGTVYDGYLRENDPTGEKVVFEDGNTAPYDLSDDLCRFQWGIEVGTEFRAYKHLGVTLQLDWGLKGIFPGDYETITFAMYPIYANIGVAYIF